MAKSPRTLLTRPDVAALERLQPRLAALLRQIGAVATKKPGEPLPAAVAKLGRELLAEARRLLGREGKGLPPLGPAPAHGSLATALGQAVAALESFEVAHSGWHAGLKCQVWEVEGEPLPVTRLLPPGFAGRPVVARNPQADATRRDLHKLIMLRYRAGYDEGYADAQAGKPPNGAYAQLVWDRLMEKEQGLDAARRAGLPLPKVKYSRPPRHLVPKGATLPDPPPRRRG